MVPGVRWNLNPERQTPGSPRPYQRESRVSPPPPSRPLSQPVVWNVFYDRAEVIPVKFDASWAVTAAVVTVLFRSLLERLGNVGVWSLSRITNHRQVVISLSPPGPSSFSHHGVYDMAETCVFPTFKSARSVDAPPPLPQTLPQKPCQPLLQSLSTLGSTPPWNPD